MVADAECEEKALAWAKLADGIVHFTLPEEIEVSLGIIVNLTGQSSFGINAFKLEGTTLEPLTPSDPTGINSQLENNVQCSTFHVQSTNAVYDLSGRKVPNVQSKKILYIKDGKKVLY